MSDLIKREDVISREWILKEFDKGKPMLCQSEYFAELFWLVRHAPAVENKGEWIDKGWHGDWQFEIDGRGNCWKAFECSNCNTTSKVQTNFCPNCGAKMKGAE